MFQDAENGIQLVRERPVPHLLTESLDSHLFGVQPSRKLYAALNCLHLLEKSDNFFTRLVMLSVDLVVLSLDDLLRAIFSRNLHLKVSGLQVLDEVVLRLDWL